MDALLTLRPRIGGDRGGRRGVPFPAARPKAREEYERRQYEEAHTSEAYARMGRVGRY